MEAGPIKIDIAKDVGSIPDKGTGIQSMDLKSQVTNLESSLKEAQDAIVSLREYCFQLFHRCEHLEFWKFIISSATSVFDVGAKSGGPFQYSC